MSAEDDGQDQGQHQSQSDGSGDGLANGPSSSQVDGASDGQGHSQSDGLSNGQGDSASNSLDDGAGGGRGHNQRESQSDGTGDGVGAAAQGAWVDDHRFAVVVGAPEVAAAIGNCAAAARVPVSGEQFLAMAAVVMPHGGAMLNGAARGRRTALKHGWSTEKTQEAEIPAPIGRVIASVLCSMARHAQFVRSVEQRADGCGLTADIPSDFKTFGGVLRVFVGRGPDGRTIVWAQAHIPGQLFDWGKSKQTLTTLFADLWAALPAALPAAPPTALPTEPAALPAALSAEPATPPAALPAESAGATGAIRATGATRATEPTGPADSA